MNKVYKVLSLMILFVVVLFTGCDKSASCYTTADISYRDGVSVEVVGEITKILGNVPELTDEFFADGGNVYITNLDVKEEYEIDTEYDIVGGFYSDKYKKIVISEDYIDKFSHEFGHYLYHKYSIENDSAFNKVFKAEVEKLVDLTGRDYFSVKSEFFAESFYYYIEEREILKDNIPLTYGYIDMLLESAKSDI